MAVKVVNNTASPDCLVPILLIFGAYLYMHSMDPLASSIIQKAALIDKAMNEVRKIEAEN